MITSYTSPTYTSTAVVARYVRFISPDVYKWVEINVKNETIKEGHCLELELPPHIAVNAARRGGTAFSFVEWPIEK